MSDTGTNPTRRSRPAPSHRRGSCRRSSPRCRSAAGRGSRRPGCSRSPPRNVRTAFRWRCRHLGLEVGVVLFGAAAAGPRCTRPISSRTASIGGDGEVALDDIGQPQPVVGDVRADAAAGRRDATSAAHHPRRTDGLPRAAGAREPARAAGRSARSRPAAGRGTRRRHRPGRAPLAPTAGRRGSGRRASRST